ncbi:eukaryotic translation initiation factor 4B [Anabrus simplex]|uniref:eukaryotic translation initiation factor 4B n=1 Tax=Anabrus simplex TaxID=316456 RepID=UPI0034DD9BB6
MSSGKKGKKTKGITVPLTDFLADAPGPAPATRYVPRKTGNWADEVDNDEDYFESSRLKEKVVLPTGPRSTWGPEIDDSKIPKNPPFLAFISNVPYEVDEDEISAFFKDLKIANVRLPRDDRPGGIGKLKGFGYIEFENRQSLIAALSMPDISIKNRRIRIDVADNSSENDRRRGGRDMMRDMGRDREGSEQSMGNWRSGPRDDLGADDRDRGGGFGRDRDGGFDRGSRSGGGRRDFGGFREGFGDRDRDRGGGGSFRDGFGGDRGRDSFGGDRDRGRFGDRDGFDRGGFSDRRGGDRERDFGRDGGFGPRRGFSDFGRDGGVRDGGGREGGVRDARDGDSFRGGDREETSQERGEPRGRPRLNLQPRTKPIEEVAAPPPVPPPSKAPASIFGGAKPVDTSAREREIEERLARERGDAPRTALRKDEKSEDARSKSGSIQGDDESSQVPPRRMDPAPPPNENVWTQRTQHAPSSRSEYPEGNGRVSPHSEPSDQELDRGRRYQDRSNSPRRRSPDHDDRQQGSRRYQERSDLSPRRRSPDHDDRQQGNRKYQDRTESPPRRRSPGDERQQGSRRFQDRPDSSPRRRSQDRDSRPPQRKTYERDDRGRDGRGGRGPPSGPAKGGSGGGDRSGPPPRGGGGDRQRGKEVKSEREPRKDSGGEDATRMPKYHEQEVPNFAGSNKFAYLHSDDEPGSD